MIRTVTGDIPKASATRALIHEHISCASNDFIKAFGTKWLDRRELAVYAADVLVGMRERHGLSLMVDGTPIDLGRDVQLMRDVSLASGVSIVASSGFYWHPSFETNCNSANDLAEWLLMDCEVGMEGGNIKPGILKCADGLLGMNEAVVKRHAAVGIVQSKTGLPLYAHCEHVGEQTFEQIELLTHHGAAPERIIIGHAAHRPDADYLARILDMGCYVTMDQCHCFPDRLEEIAQCLVTLCERGYGERILLGNDYCIHSDFAARRYNGMHLDKQRQLDKFGHVFCEVHDAFLAAGGKQEDYERMLTSNTWNVLDV